MICRSFSRILTENLSERAALRTERQKQLEINHREHQATWKEGEADQRLLKHTPGKKTAVRL
jgi:hypothetical protein